MPKAINRRKSLKPIIFLQAITEFLHIITTIMKSSYIDHHDDY